MSLNRLIGINDKLKRISPPVNGRVTCSNQANTFWIMSVFISSTPKFIKCKINLNVTLKGACRTCAVQKTCPTSLSRFKTTCLRCIKQNIAWVSFQNLYFVHSWKLGLGLSGLSWLHADNSATTSPDFAQKHDESNEGYVSQHRSLQATSDWRGYRAKLLQQEVSACQRVMREPDHNLKYVAVI